jgi:hypothetical protein
VLRRCLDRREPFAARDFRRFRDVEFAVAPADRHGKEERQIKRAKVFKSSITPLKFLKKKIKGIFPNREYVRNGPMMQ